MLGTTSARGARDIGRAQDQRHAHALLVQRVAVALVAVLAELLAVVRDQTTIVFGACGERASSSSSRPTCWSV